MVALVQTNMYQLIIFKGKIVLRYVYLLMASTIPAENTLFEKITTLLIIGLLAAVFLLPKGEIRQYCNIGLLVSILLNMISKIIRFRQQASLRMRIIWGISVLVFIYGETLSIAMRNFKWSYIGIAGVVIYAVSMLFFQTQMRKNRET